MVMSVTLSEQEDIVLQTIANKLGKNQDEILHEAIRRYILLFQQKELAIEDYGSITDEELVMMADLTFLELDEAEAENAYA